MSALRKDLRAIHAEGAAANVMVGIGENYFPAFVLALTSNELACGLVSTVPLILGAFLQLISPYAVAWLKSYRRWVVICAVVQAVGFLPLAAAATVWNAPVILVFAVVSLYWATGMGGGPAWNAWVSTLVPRRLWARYFGRRTRLSQLGLVAGFALGGTVLQWGVHRGQALAVFAVLFAVAAGGRMMSSRLLARQRELAPPGPELQGLRLTALVRSLREDADGRLLLYLLAAQTAVQISAPYFNPYMLGQLHFGYVHYMLLLCVAMLAKAMVLPAMGRLAERFGASRVLWICAAGIAPLPAMWLVSNRFAYLIGLQTYSGMVWAGYELAMLLLFFETIPTEKRLGVLTIFNLANSAATVLGSVVGAWILTSLSTARGTYETIFIVSSLARGAALFLLVRAAYVAMRRKAPAVRVPALRPAPGVADQPVLVYVKSSSSRELRLDESHFLPGPRRSRRPRLIVPDELLDDTVRAESVEVRT